MVSPIQIAFLRISIVVSCVSLLFYTVDVSTIGTEFMVSYVSVYGAMSYFFARKMYDIAVGAAKNCVCVRI